MHIKEALKSKYSILVFIDIFMMAVLIVNLSLILFDWIFTISFINQFLQINLPDFYSIYYEYVHLNFKIIDFGFVVLFICEFIFSWILAIIQKIYFKWFFYPFLHWYDLLGCIPVGSFRFLRVLRVFSILVRLQNLKIIDLTNTYLFSVFKKYYGIVVEEVSDRVVVNILEGIQVEIATGGPVIDQIINDVIKPKQHLIVEWISLRLENALERDVLVRQPEIEQYVRSVISESLGKSTELKVIEQLPLMGKKITETIQNAISDIINNIIEKALTDLASYKNRDLVNDATNLIMNSIEHKDEDARLNDIFKDISIEVLDIVKKQVQVQQWKEQEIPQKSNNLE